MKRNTSRTIFSTTTAGLIAGIAFSVFAFAPTSASAQMQTICANHDDMVKYLGKAHGEHRSAMGLDAAGNMIEMFVSSNGSWTLALTKPGGPTCVMSAGESWMQEVVKTEVDAEERSS